MPKFYISITVSVDAEDFDDAPFAYDTNHWCVEQDEFGEDE